jgi:peptidoglycan-associated lipoprotein
LLSSNPEVTVILEGHADERGTREYNLALGERRANAVQQLLVLQGVAQSQIQVISFGEERPVALGHDGEAWRLNRRVEILYSGY